jgi:hypothetical protein
LAISETDSFIKFWRVLGTLESLGELLDILGRPARNFYAKVQTLLRQHFLDLV